MSITGNGSTRTAVKLLTAMTSLLAVTANASQTFQGFNLLNNAFTNANTAKVSTWLNQAQTELKFNKFLKSETSSYSPNKIVDNKLSNSVFYNQKYNGVEILGNQVSFHYNDQAQLEHANGKAFQTILNTTPSLTEANALQILSDRYQTEVKLSNPMKLNIYRNQGIGRDYLIYKALVASTPSLKGKEVYIDAHTGEILAELSRECTLIQDHLSRAPAPEYPIYVHSANTEQARAHADPDSGFPTEIKLTKYGTLDQDWYPLIVEKQLPSPSQPPIEDESAVRAFKNAYLSYKFYWDNFQLDSYDGSGSQLTNVVHMGLDMANAFWTSENSLLAYGDGRDIPIYDDNGKKVDTLTIKDLTYGVDVAGHELTHAVTQYTGANLLYIYEAGALNESLSDTFGKLIEAKGKEISNWYIGSDVIDTKHKGIRNMMNPTEFGDPDTNDSQLKVQNSGFCYSANDNCGVHQNSGIPNKIAALIITSLGNKKAQELYYATSTGYLHSDSSFGMFRTAMQAACNHLYGSSSKECSVVKDAFDKAKIKATTDDPISSDSMFSQAGSEG